MRYTNLFIAICFSLLAHSQVEKRVVVEHFTNTYCSTCASRNPGLYANINQQDDLLHLSYHPSVPYPQCTLNQHNKAENDARTQFYGILTGTPRIVVQGDVIPASTNYNDASIFTSQQGEMSPYALAMALTPTTASTLNLRVVIRLDGGTPLDSANLFAGIFEDTVFMNSPNGEKDPKNVFRKAFTNMDGNKIALPQANGDSVVLTYSVPVNNEWELDALFAAVLLQADDKSLIQSGSSRDVQSSNPVGILSAPEEEIMLYPNPVVQQVKLTGTAANTHYRIMNAMGQVVLEGKLEQSRTIKLDFLKSGVYFLRLDGETITSLRFEKRP